MFVGSKPFDYSVNKEIHLASVNVSEGVVFGSFQSVAVASETCVKCPEGSSRTDFVVEDGGRSQFKCPGAGNYGCSLSRR